MKKILAITLTLFLISTFSFSQGLMRQSFNSSDDKAKKQASKMTEVLGLNDDQQNLIATFSKERIEKVRALKDSQDPNRRELMKQAHKDFNTKLKTVLSDEDFQKWKAWKKEQRESKGKGKGKGKGNSSDLEDEELEFQLDLEDDM